MRRSSERPRKTDRLRGNKRLGRGARTAAGRKPMVAPLRTKSRRVVASPDATLVALRRGRLALEDIHAQLGRILSALRSPVAARAVDLDRRSPDRLRAASADVQAALASLDGFRHAGLSDL